MSFVPLPPLPTDESVTLPLPPALRALSRQIDGFVQLTRAGGPGALRKAAVLYREIRHTLDRADLRFFLPSLIAPFYAQLARCGARLKEHLDAPSDLAQEALVELARLDLELFLATELDG